MKHVFPSGNFIEIKHHQETKDILLILPGGGYFFASEREAKPVAEAFSDIGMHTAIFYYRENKLKYPTIYQEGAQVIRWLKSQTFVERIFVMGFSAGGHYAAMLLNLCSKDLAGGVLAYPVITTDLKYRHLASFVNLMGLGVLKKELKLVSPELHLTKKNPPVFIWHTAEDATVHVENSLLYASALKAKNIPFELHIFPKGPHGLSLANQHTPFDKVDPKAFEQEHTSVHRWVELAKAFLKRL
jgi:acetyl esterase/lipase